MNDSSSAPPEDFHSFLSWLKDKTESAWTKKSPPALEDFVRRGMGGSAWRKGTKWQSGFSDTELDQAHARWGVEFPEEYRTFLRVLGAPTPLMFRAMFQGSTLVATDGPSFYDWAHDDDYIENACSWPLDGLLFDVESNDVWLPAWGERQESKDERRIHLSRLVDAAPKLVPVSQHRYLAHAPAAPKGYVVLSVWQTDIITYGVDLRSFLLNELSGLIGKWIDWGQARTTTNNVIGSIAFWGDLVVG
jgi:hypothetical protein